MGILSNSISSVSGAFAPLNQQAHSPARGDAVLQQQLAQATNAHISTAGTAAMVSMTSGGQLRQASYGSAKSTDAAFEKDERYSKSQKTKSGSGGTGKRLDVVA